MSHALETSLGGPARDFPSTVWDLVDRARTSRDSLEELIRIYWKPVYAYIRRGWARSIDDAKDLTQGFFLELVEKDLLATIDGRRFRLRACLKTALEHFLIDEQRVASARKRGGGVKVVPIDIAWDDGDAPAAPAPPSDAFDRAWIAALTEQAMEDLRVRLAASGREAQFAVLRRYLDSLDRDAPASYADLARELNLAVHDVTNHLHRARAELRGLIVERLRAQVSSTEDLEDELRELFV